MKIALTGATGFIGGALVKALKADGNDVFAIIRKNTSPKSLDESSVPYYVFDGSIEGLSQFFSGHKIEGVMHLASHFLAKHEIKDVPELISSNVLFSTQVLEATVQGQVKWFINTGTAWQHYENKDYSPVNLYAATKQAFQDIAQYYSQTSPLVFSTIQLHDTFGPGDTRPKLFNLWQKVLASGERLSMSKGEQIIDISYIDNVVDAFLGLAKLLSSDQNGSHSDSVYVVSSPERMILKDLARVFEEVAGAQLNIGWGERPYRYREVMEPWSKGILVPGWQPKVDLREGLRRFLVQAQTL